MLTIALDGNKKEPLYEQIYIYIREEIRAGNLKCGSKLPSCRSLATHLSVSRNTVDMAYAQLLSEGYIENMPRRGYFISKIEELANLHMYQEEKVEQKEQKKEDIFIDFSPNGVDMNAFPYNCFRRLNKEVMMEINSELFQTGDAQGELSFRKAIKQYLHESRGVNCHEDQIIIGAGSDYLILLLTQILGFQQTIAMENPAYLKPYSIFKKMEYDIEAISVDEQGICIEQLEKSSAKFLYVTPAHQYPTGFVMPIQRRLKLLEWAKKEEGRYIIEDDYDSEFRYQGKPIPSLQSIDRYQKVIYCGTFSKAIAPAIRISYLVLPWKLYDLYKKRVGFLACTVSRTDQKILESFITEGYFERHLNKMRAVYKNKRDILVKLCKKFEPHIQVKNASTGLHILLECHTKKEERELIELARKQGVKVYGISEYAIEEKISFSYPMLLLGFAKLQEEDIKKGVQLLERAWENI